MGFRGLCIVFIILVYASLSIASELSFLFDPPRSRDVFLARQDLTTLSSNQSDEIFEFALNTLNLRWDDPNGECHKRMEILKSALISESSIGSGTLFLACDDEDIEVINQSNGGPIKYVRHFANAVVQENAGQRQIMIIDPQFMVRPVSLQDYLDQVLNHSVPWIEDDKAIQSANLSHSDFSYQKSCYILFY